MTQHNIVGSEADRPLAHVVIRVGRRRMRPSPLALLFAGATIFGAITGLIDMAIGAPVTLCLAGLVLFIWRIWPDRRTGR